MTDPDGLTRLWTPYRMEYVRSDTTADGCPFCRIRDGDDEANLIVARGEATYAVLNLHPYNPGHLMVLPYRHVAELDDLTLQESGELMAMTQQAIRVIRAVSSPHAFTDGLAQAVTLLALGVDPDVIVLGGGVTEAGEPLRLALVEALETRAAGSAFLASLDLSGRLRLVPEGPVAAIGAAMLGAAPVAS